jgi:hypothetical protein
MERPLFLAGVPATGKSWLGCWLAEHGYIHIDAEKDGGADFDRTALHQEWNNLVATGRATVFMAAVKTITKPVVVNWGFPTRFIYVVSALQAEGAHTWWLHASRDLARKAFATREALKSQSQRIHIQCFEKQMDDIEREWLLISSVFGKRIVVAIREDGRQRTPEELWSEMAQAG